MSDVIGSFFGAFVLGLCGLFLDVSGGGLTMLGQTVFYGGTVILIGVGSVILVRVPNNGATGRSYASFI